MEKSDFNVEYSDEQTRRNAHTNYGALPQGKVVAELNDSRQTLWRKVFPCGFKKELKKIFSLSWPVILTALFNYMLEPISLIFCGHLGRAELDGVALACSLLNITGLAMCSGLSTACDTLFSQAFGGKNKRLYGIYFQRSLLIICLSCFVCWAIHLNAEGLCIALGQDPEVAAIAATYLLYFMPGLLFNFLFQIFVKYLQNQNKIYPPVFVGALGNIFNALAQYVAVYALDYGIRGSAVAQVLSFFVMSMTTLLYIRYSSVYHQTWTGWSWQALDNWGSFLRLAIPGLIMIAIELWSFEIGIFLNGLLGEVELGATSVTFQIEAVLYMIPLGISLACSIRVGQNLGAGDLNGAKTSSRVAQAFALMVFIVSAIILLSLKDVLPKIFTSDSEIVDLVSKSLPLIVLIQFLDSITSSSMGTLRGCGRQLTGAICNFAGYVVLTIPLAVVLMFVVKVGALGFWMGLAGGISVVCIAYIIIMVRINWGQQVEMAQERFSEYKKKSVVNTEESPLIVDDQDVILASEEDMSAMQAKMCLSHSLEISMTESVDTSLTFNQKARLIAKRSLAVLVILCIFFAGLLTRLYVPIPISDGTDMHSNITKGITLLTRSG